MKKKSILITLSFMIIWSFITIYAITWGNRSDWPDAVHLDYGFPFVWSTQTLSTIIGTVNLWTVDIAALIMNLILWLGIMFITSSVIIYSDQKVKK